MNLGYEIRPPFATHELDVGGGHTLYVEESGNPEGIPALFLHGGPGSGTKPEHREYFNPEVYRIVLFDQRGCGQSRADNPLQNNTTEHLVADIEQIREGLGIEAWGVVFGSSWGSTLGLVYAQAHPARVARLVVASIFLADMAALGWFTDEGKLRAFYPNEFNDILSCLGLDSEKNIFTRFYDVLSQGGNSALKAAQAFSVYDAFCMEISPNRDEITAYIRDAGESLIGSNRLYAHYVKNQCFLEKDQILKGCKKLKDMPVTILHGELDLCCTPDNAYRLHVALPHSTLTMVPACGHRSNDAMKAARVAAINEA